jgi:urea carboxylase
MFSRVLIANRGEIACRIIRTLNRLGIASIAVYSQADRYAPHALRATHAISIGAAPAAQSYLDPVRIIEAARACGAQAIHPGYGFLSENADFAEACADQGIVFIGPTPAQLRLFGLKHTAREAAQRAGVTLAPGSALVETAEAAHAEAARIGYPVMLKGTAGGGGIGLQLCRTPAEMDGAFERARRLAGRSFGNAGVFVESWIEHGRHIEVQIFGDGKGRVLALGERDCSPQRRHQKLIEETPPPGIPPETLADLRASATRLGESVNYASAGTVEFIFDTQKEKFYFLEVNTRLQVEHCITEAVTGLDLVEWMVRQAADDPAWAGTFAQSPPPPTGAAIEARVYAEDPARDFQPATGTLTHVHFPKGARIETWVESGTEITPYYDPLLAKIIVHGANRAEARAKLQAALAATCIAGIETNLAFLRQIAASPEFTAGRMTTRALETIPYAPRTIDVIEGGTLTTVQDLPGRLGYWAVGIPPSGPMDALSHAHANAALGNPPGAATLEITLQGPTLRFNTACRICLSGAELQADLAGAAIPWHTPIAVPAGATLRLGAVRGPGCRAYLAVQSGIDVPLYLGSRATFTLGHFGGHGGRAIAAGDVLHLADAPQTITPSALPTPPPLSNTWQIEVLEGPHAAPDFFTEADLAAFYAADWEVHYNSSRTGVRLIGPKPAWARPDGGEAGLHPSNIHDTPYAIGAIDFTGDMPVILGPDGPSLGGFVCPCTITTADLWKIGQLRPNDRIRFIRRPTETGAILHRIPASADRPEVTYRRAGDANLLIEYGAPVLDLELRLRGHALMLHLQDQSIPGIIDITPGIRSVQVHIDPAILTLDVLLARLITAEEALPNLEDMEIPSRIVHLPLSWDDPSTRLAIARYTQSVRPDAPWCPSNIEFIRRINGLPSIDDVKRIVFDASYLVLGLGDVYLGAPVATPIDPRHRLVTTKYNPARTWTPENAVGIGGAYLCIYGMEGPGGYQFVGRTCQVWNTYHTTQEFAAGTPWLLRFFDQLRFYEVSEAELTAFRADFPQGCATLRIENTIFSLRDYRRLLADNADSIADWQTSRQAAFDAERVAWAAAGMLEPNSTDNPPPPEEEASLTPGQRAISSPVSGSIWRLAVSQGASVQAGEVLVVIESMKTEITIPAPFAGTIAALSTAEGRPIRVGQRLCILQTDPPPAPENP